MQCIALLFPSPYDLSRLPAGAVTFQVFFTLLLFYFLHIILFLVLCRSFQYSYLGRAVDFKMVNPKW